MSEAPQARSKAASNGPSAESDASLRPAEKAALRCEARGVKKAFGATPILKGVDLEIPEGSFAVLVGPSGCGKSTLLRLVAGLEMADEGSIALAGKDVTNLPPRDRDIAMVFQSYALYPHLTVRDNLKFGLELRKTPQSVVEKRIDEASAMLGLEKLLDRLPKQLSGGQRQRVAMGRAIVRRPNIFLFDEPLSNLDAALRAEVRVEIRRLHDRLKATTLYVTHDQVEAMTLADTLWVLNGGLVEQKGPPLEVYEHPRTKFVATFLGSPQMNMVDGKIVKQAGRTYAEGGGVRALVEHDLDEGREVTIGIRPHDLVLAKNGAESIAELKVELVERMGFEAFAHGWLRGSRRADGTPTSTVSDSSPLTVIARLEAEDAKSLQAGSVAPLAAHPSRVHLFDPKTGVSCAAR